MRRILLAMLLGCLLSRSVPAAEDEEMLTVVQMGTDGDVVVLCQGPSPYARFELGFSRRAGGISSWHDLDRDPERRLNLAGHGGLPQTALLTHMLRAGDARSGQVFYSAPAEKITVIEENLVRARLRLEGVYSTAARAERWRPGPRRRGLLRGDAGYDPDTRFLTTYTVYPTGQLYVGHSLSRATGTLTVGESAWVLATAPARFRAVGSVGDAGPGTQSTLLLHTSNGPGYFADALLVPHGRPLSIGRWGESFVLGPEAMGATRSSFELHEPGTIIGVQEVRWSGLLQLEPDWTDGAAQAAVVARAYRTAPALATEPGWGEVNRGGHSDVDVDGFAEEEGCYVVRSARQGCRLRFELSDSLLDSPVIKLLDWPGSPPTTLTLDGEELTRGRQFQAARIDRSAIVVQVYRKLSGGTVELELRSGLSERE